ncbi:hypothetical protein PXH78_18430, partial [Mycolicibacterium smegmatis]|uniref:hypothetical protein n=1 Tax=Mycolicibacterium smegmatis TaxID=1772 RepID=UPI0023DB836F
GASPSASAILRTNAAEYGGPALADHDESHPAGTNATANCEEPKNALVAATALRTVSEDARS